MKNSGNFMSPAWCHGAMGRWGDGAMGRWGDGAMGRWGDRALGTPEEMHYIAAVLREMKAKGVV